ncbi:MAG TPA: SBBP repeat-containing protein [Chitinophagaceae bacterium]|nr:SBBP repeat-containing protein [Chitinophagaceae bacterium]
MSPNPLKKFVLIFLISISGISNAQEVVYEWAHNNGGNGSDNFASSVTDISGNVYTTGHFQGTVDMDPGAGVFMMTALGNLDIYIIKYDASGNFIWARQLGGATPGDEQVRDIAIDGFGNLYLTGFFRSTVDFDPGPGVFNVTCIGSGYAAFFLKLDNNGNFGWAKNIAQTDYGSNGISIACGTSGNLYVTGGYKGITDLDPGPGTNMSGSATSEDVFISKFDNSGNYLWSKQFYCSSTGSVYSIALDPSENIYTTGLFTGTTDFDPGPGTFNLISNDLTWSDAFITRLDANGNFVWARLITGTLDQYAHGIAIDPTGNVIVTGYFMGITDFDPGPGSVMLDGAGRAKTFVLKLDAAGNFIWVRDFNGAGNCSCVASSVAIDVAGDIYTTGVFYGIIDFDGGASTQELIATNPGDIFISKLKADGSYVFAKRMGDGLAAYGHSITVDPAKNIYVAGYFTGNVDFDPNPPLELLYSNGFTDAFILKFSQCLQATSETIDVTACGTYTANNQTYTTSGTYIQKLVNIYGCDSTLTINLKIGGSQTTMNATSCDSYLWEGNTYTTSGSYTVILTGSDGCDSIRKLALLIRNRVNTTVDVTLCEGQSYQSYSSSGMYIDNYTGANGCDSTRTLNLIVKARSYSTLNATICQGENYLSYTSTGVFRDTLVAANGCDSIRTINLLVNPKAVTNLNASICQGESYFVAGAGQVKSGIYKDTLQTRLGCDSVIITNLVVHPKPVPNLGADKNLCQGQSITLNAGTFISYLWQDLTSQPTFTTNAIGQYWVQVTDINNCTNNDTVEIKNIFSNPSGFLNRTDTICQYEKITIAPFTSYSQYAWSNGSMQSRITVDKPGQYILTVKDVNNCMGKDTIDVIQKVCQSGVWIPNAFTPDGNQLNDVFRAMVYGITESFKFQVFDRWGNLVFETTDPMKGWDGKVKGIPVTTSVFVWQCSYKLKGAQQEFQKGTVTLIR